MGQLDKVFLSIGENPSNSSYMFLFDENCENLIVELHFLYIFNTHVKFRSNRMLFTIRSINLFFIHNFKPQKLEI